MQGFDPKFRDFPDYILGITHEIWEERGVEKIGQYYAPDIIVRSPTSIVTGNNIVIDATHATLQEFPDRQLLGEDVIWSGTPETGMLSSHRILSTATHSNDGVYGKASGKQLVYRVIADCHAIDNVINDEWLIRDQAAIVRQLGVAPKDYARQQLQPTTAEPLTPANDRAGPYTGSGNDNEWGIKLEDALQRITHGDPTVFDDTYDRAAHLEYPGFITAHGASQAKHFWTQLCQALPDAQFSVHHRIGRADALMPPRAAIRWSLAGTHSGSGYFGEPTGAEVYILGITHAEFGSHPTLRRPGKPV